MSGTRIIFILISLLVSGVIITIGVIIQKNGNRGVMTVRSLFDSQTRTRRKSATVTPKSMGSYFTVVLVAALVLLVLYYSR